MDYSSAFDNHEFVVVLSDKEIGLSAYIAVHSTALGIAHGGTRMNKYASDKEALDDVLNLSRAMSYKSAMADLPYGGAKGVINFDPNHPDKNKILRAYAQKIQMLGGLFHTGTDVGLTDDDTKIMSEECDYILGLNHGQESQFSTSKAASQGVFNAMLAAASYTYGSDDLSDKTVGVKGVGKLGSELVRLLIQGGAKVMIADTDQEKVLNVSKNYPSVVVVNPDEIHAKTMDIYAPCALGSEFNPDVINTLNCKLIVGGANNQLPDDHAGTLLHEKGILYIPDYIANAGGLIFVCEDLEADGFNNDRMISRLENIKNTVIELLKRSKEENLPPYIVADKIGKERITKGKS